MIQKSTLDFLKTLKKNNNKDRFDKNKENTWLRSKTST